MAVSPIAFGRTRAILLAAPAPFAGPRPTGRAPDSPSATLETVADTAAVTVAVVVADVDQTAPVTSRPPRVVAEEVGLDAIINAGLDRVLPVTILAGAVARVPVAFLAFADALLLVDLGLAGLAVKVGLRKVALPDIDADTRPTLVALHRHVVRPKTLTALAKVLPTKVVHADIVVPVTLHTAVVAVTRDDGLSDRP